jgi:anthranilate/para-aminobenzoate synthase component I
MVGSALTANADPEKEYEECLVKAESLFQSLEIRS